MAKRELLKIIKQYISIIRLKGYQVSSVYLFGSYAKNSSTSESDIDIAVIIENVNDYFETRVELMKLRRNVNLYIEPHPIDVKDFKSHPLFNEITKAGLKISF